MAFTFSKKLVTDAWSDGTRITELVIISSTQVVQLSCTVINSLFRFSKD